MFVSQTEYRATEIVSTSFTFTNAKKFDSVNINDANIIGILDVFDSNGNQWYEVPNLAQENVYNTIRNTDTNDPNFINDPEVPYLLELKTVQRRFAARFIDSGSLQLHIKTVQAALGTMTSTINDVSSQVNAVSVVVNPFTTLLTMVQLL